MKGEFPPEEDQDDNHHHHHHHSLTPNTTKFPTFPPPHTHPTSRATTPNSRAPKTTPLIQPEDGATIELSRRPRGRPPGSKNKPKPPYIITRHTEPPMAPYILEIPTDTDVIDSLTSFTRRRGISLCILAASGAVTNVTLKQPSTSPPGGTVTFHGCFDILSLSAVLLVNTAPFGGGDGGFAFTISLAGPQGQIVGGKVVGPLLSEGTIYVVAASFSSPTYHRLPREGEQVGATASGGGGGGGSPVSGGAMEVYSCHNLGSSSNSDVIWAPNASVRAPAPPY